MNGSMAFYYGDKLAKIIDHSKMKGNTGILFVL